MRDIRLWLQQNYGMLLGIGLFVLMFWVYVQNLPNELNVNIVNTAAVKGVLLALIAMAQTVPVLTAGLDLSAGMIFILTNCIASYIVVGTPLEAALGIVGVLASGAAAGFLNGAIVVWGRLQPIITTLATGAIFYGIALLLRPIPGGDVQPDIADFVTGNLFNAVPTVLLVLLAVVVLVWMPFRRSELGRGCYACGSSAAAAYMSGVQLDRSRIAAYTLSGLLCAIAGLIQTFYTYSGEASAASGGTYTLNSIASVVIGGTSLFGGSGGAVGSIFGAFVLRTIGDLLFVFDLPPLWQPLFQGVVLLLAVSLGAARVFRVKNRLSSSSDDQMIASLRNIDRPVVIAFAFIVVLLVAGSLYSPNFLSATYLLQQLQVASFLGIIASGAMLVILLGHIDLSVPWVVTAGGMMATASLNFFGEIGTAVAIPFALLIGLVFGLVNGLGVAFLRIPSMIFTLGINAVAQGIMVLHTGGFAPQDHATPLMHWLATGRSIGGIPNALFVWMAVGAVVLFILGRTPLGRYIYAIGNRESAAYLSGIDTRLVLIFCFGFSGMCAALAGVLLAGYSTKAYQAMGDPYLLPAIAAVVLGGTNILGGRGSFLGTIAGVILISLLTSILSVMQMPEAGRQIIYGSVIIGMLLVYGRGERVGG